MKHPSDRSPKVLKMHLWELDGERHHRCGICWLVIPQHLVAMKSLPMCRPDGGNEDYCVSAPSRKPWPIRERTHSDSWYDRTGDCAWCGAPTELPKPGYSLPESNCRHNDIADRGSATCSWCGKMMAEDVP